MPGARIGTGHAGALKRMFDLKSYRNTQKGEIREIVDK